ncbi:MAG: DUF1570 domain-containing protein, partial [Planctomycetaceae bacterium]|nr:DUF1570 domain-containing protein [Planctomycetaceae bacterium]
MKVTLASGGRILASGGRQPPEAIRSILHRVFPIGICLAISLALPHPALADVVFYTLPGGKAQVILQGTAGINPGGAITFTHPKFGKIYFDSQETEIRKVPTLPAQFTKVLGRAASDADKLMEAAQWALRHGLLTQFHQAVDKALAANPKHPRALLVQKLKTLMDVELPDPATQVEDMKKLLGRRDMKVKLSKHFILMHDTPDTPAKGSKKTRAEERIQLLEAVYESFLLRFYAYGVELEIPKERLKVVLFNEYDRYRAFSTRLSPSLASASGFWSPGNNTAIFFDHGTNEEFKALAKVNTELQKLKADALRDRTPATADIRRLADTLALLIELERENSDIEVVSHEITHQMAGNTGLLPRHVQVPRWVHEGLATYFETPNGASWGGIGKVVVLLGEHQIFLDAHVISGQQPWQQMITYRRE